MSNAGLVSFITNLITLRKMRDLKQEELAHYAGISIRKYQRLESGETVPTLEDLYALASALEVNTSQLLTNADEKPRNVHFYNQIKIESVHNDNTKEFVSYLNDYFLPNYAVEDFSFLNLENVARDVRFYNSKKPMLITNFKTCLLNNSFTKEFSKDNTKPIRFLNEFKTSPQKMMQTFNYILSSNEQFLTMEDPHLLDVEDNSNVVLFGFVNRKKLNNFMILTVM